MRIISQDRKFNFPYDNVIIENEQNETACNIVAFAVGRVGITIGTYNSPDKAKKVFRDIMLKGLDDIGVYTMPREDEE